MSKRPVVLVTGGAGYIGSHAARALRRAGFEPVVFDNLSTGHRRAVRWGTLVEGDLCDRACIEHTLKTYQVEAVLHFAASAYVGESVRDPLKYFSNNVANSLNLLAAMLSCGVKNIVASSSCTVYGTPQYVPIDELHPLQPLSPYGESKLFVEKVLNWYGQAYGLRWAALRYFNAAGADPDGEIGENHDPETHLIPLAILAAQGKHACLQIYGTDYPTPDGTAIRDYIHVTDLADAHVSSLQHLMDGGTPLTLNLGTGQGQSVQDIVCAIERLKHTTVPVEFSPRRPGDAPAAVANPAQAMQKLGWQPRYADLDTVIDTAWRWHAQQE
jgi:UDP-arabinose 4-epimerase